MKTLKFLPSRWPFARRHIGPSEEELSQILEFLKVPSLEALLAETLPLELQNKADFKENKPLSEQEVLQKAKHIAAQNKVFKSYIGQGYVPCHTPGVIQRTVLENPIWYTSYTPYQSELAQGRLEALFNFQSMTADLTGFEIANSSLLDEGTALAEAVALARHTSEKPDSALKVFVDQNLWPQSRDVLQTRAESMGWEMQAGSFKDFKAKDDFFAAVLSYPDSKGEVPVIEPFLRQMHSQNIKTIVTTDLLSLCLLKPPGKMGADVAVGSSQRFGIPLFFGGPSAAFFATKKEYASAVPGRLVGLSKDRHGNRAYRLALQTREQHIRRDKATSNICTSQALLATMAGFYAVYHGPEGLKNMALCVHSLTKFLEDILRKFPGKLLNKTFFDTLLWQLNVDTADAVQKAFLKEQINVGRPQPDAISFTLNETTDLEDILVIQRVLEGVFNSSAQKATEIDSKSPSVNPTSLDVSITETGDKGLREQGFSNENLKIPESCRRQTPFLSQAVFNSYHTETKLLRYITKLQNRELSLAQSMIPLGSCTMKLNAVGELMPLAWPGFADVHPFAPREQTKGYLKLIEELESQLCDLTGFSRFSFQPNAGSQGEYAGLLAIRKYHISRGEKHRTLCLIPSSAHGTNPASAVMAGFEVRTVHCGQSGEIDRKDLERKLQLHGKNLAGLMITYPSTHGIFEEGISEICDKVHQAGGLVYLDGANMNALLGLCKPCHLGFDVCHLNLHKTFCIPHGGGGPGVGPVGLSRELSEFLPSHGFLDPNGAGKAGSGAVSSSPYGSAALLAISWSYISLMGYQGLKKSAQVAIANANYIAKKLEKHYRVLFTGKTGGRVAHECIIDCRKFKNTADVSINDIAKRLMDYGFHAPTMSWPVAGTFMIEPTESESLDELDRFCDSLIAIRREIALAEKSLGHNSLLKNAPHTMSDLISENWSFSYSKTQAVFPMPWLRENKFWPSVARVENAYGDIHLHCCHPPDLGNS